MCSLNAVKVLFSLVSKVPLSIMEREGYFICLLNSVLIKFKVAFWHRHDYL